MSLAQSRKNRDNLSSLDDLIRKVNRIDSQTIAINNAITNLHREVDAVDKQQVLDLRALLISNFRAALNF